MKIMEETTEWSEATAVNHVYVFKSKPTGRTAEAIAYIPFGETKVHKFKKPLTLDLKGRTFREVE